MNVYEKNLAVLIAVNPELGAALSSVQGNVDFEVFVDNNDPLNTNLLHVKTNQPLFNTTPIAETNEQLNRIESSYQRYPMLYFYGFGNGVLYKLLLQNKLHERIVVIEPQMELIYIALNLYDFTQEISDGRLVILLESQVNLSKAIEIFYHKQAKIFIKTYFLEPFSKFYEYNFSSQILDLNRLFLRAIEHVIYGLGNDTNDALMGLEYHMANVLKMVETPTLVELVTKAKTTDTAIIVSTGPSLQKQLPLLKKIQNHVTIFCVDASFPILEREGIKPDVVVSIERVYETAKFYQNTSKEFQEDVVFAVSSIVHPSLLGNIKAGTLQINMRPLGYTRAFKDLREYGYVGSGMSAANLAYGLIFHSKFKQCILIGQDLAYGKDGTSHSEGHLYGINDRLKDENILWVQAYGGKGTVKTNKVWNLFRNFFENDIYQANKQLDMVTINATEGGARIEGATEMSFSNACNQYINTSATKQKIILKKPAKSKIKKDKQKVSQKIQEIENFAAKIVDKAEKIFIDVMNVCKQMDKVNLKDDNQLDKIDFDKLAKLMRQIDVIKEYFDQELFTDVFMDAMQAMIVHQELDLAKIQVRSAETDIEKKRKMIDWIYAHQQWLMAFVSIARAVNVAINRRGGESRFVHKAKFDDKGYSIDGYFGDYTCKDTQFEIEMLVDGKVAKSLHVDTKGKEKASFNMSVPSKFFNNHIHEVALREKTTGIVLMGTPGTHVYLEQDKNQALFMESLENVDEEKIKDMYCPNAIGFLATEENLEDEEFVGYIKELMERFPDVEFKGFCFNNKQKDLMSHLQLLNIKVVETNHVNTIRKNIEIFLGNLNSNNIYNLNEYLRNENIATIWFIRNNKKLSIKQWESLNKVYLNIFLENLDFFGFKEIDLKNAQNSFWIMLNNRAQSDGNISNWKNLNLEDTIYQVYNILFIDYVLSSSSFKFWYYETLFFKYNLKAKSD